MLDQNTDRMWFVIGAVIVGAAIIFIANGTIPEIFASVSESFEDQSDKATDVVDTMDVYGSNLNMEMTSKIRRMKSYNMLSGANWEYAVFNYQTGNYVYDSDHFLMTESYIEVEPNTEYYIASNLRYEDEVLRGYETAWTYYTEDYQTIEGENTYNVSYARMTSPANARYVRVRYGYPRRENYSYPFTGRQFFFGKYEDIEHLL